MVVLSFDGLSFSFDGPMITCRPLCITYPCVGEVTCRCVGEVSVTGRCIGHITCPCVGDVTCPCVGEVNVTGPCVGGITCPSVGDLPHQLILYGFCQQSRKTMNSKDLKALHQVIPLRHFPSLQKGPLLPLS